MQRFGFCCVIVVCANYCLLATERAIAYANAISTGRLKKQQECAHCQQATVLLVQLAIGFFMVAAVIQFEGRFLHLIETDLNGYKSREGGYNMRVGLNLRKCGIHHLYLPYLLLSSLFVFIAELSSIIVWQYL